MHEHNLMSPGAEDAPAPRPRSFDSEQRDRRAVVACLLWTLGFFLTLKAIGMLGDLRDEAEDDYNAERAAYNAAVGHAEQTHYRGARARQRAKACQ